MTYRTMESAPKDGTIVRAKISNGIESDVWSFRSKWVDGLWCADFGTDKAEQWKPVDPQPRFWRPI